MAVAMGGQSARGWCAQQHVYQWPTAQPPLASGSTACSNMLHVRQANSVSRGDEAIAAAEVLVLRDELESSRRKEAVTAKALGERSEVRTPAQRMSEPRAQGPAVARVAYVPRCRSATHG